MSTTASPAPTLRSSAGPGNSAAAGHRLDPSVPLPARHPGSGACAANVGLGLAREPGAALLTARNDRGLQTEHAHVAEQDSDHVLGAALRNGCVVGDHDDPKLTL